MYPHKTNHMFDVQYCSIFFFGTKCLLSMLLGFVCWVFPMREFCENWHNEIQMWRTKKFSVRITMTLMCGGLDEAWVAEMRDGIRWFCFLFRFAMNCTPLIWKSVNSIYISLLVQFAIVMSSVHVKCAGEKKAAWIAWWATKQL